MNTSKIIVVAASCVFLAAQASAATLFGIDCQDTSGTGSSAIGVDPVVTVATVSANVYQRGAGLTAVNTTNAYTNNNWMTTSLAAAITANDFITWSFSSSMPLNLTEARFASQRSNTGPANIALQFMETGASSFTTVATSSSVPTSASVFTVDMSAFTNVSGGTFRFVGWGATETAGTLRLSDNAGVAVLGVSAPKNVSFVLEGEPVPEPATMTILAAAGLLAARRRKSR